MVKLDTTDRRPDISAVTWEDRELRGSRRNSDTRTARVMISVSVRVDVRRVIPAGTGPIEFENGNSKVF